jgi:hypothetical protein
VARCYGQCALADVRPTLRPRQSKTSPPAWGGGVPVASKYQPACRTAVERLKTLDGDMRHSAARRKRLFQDQPVPTVGEQESSRLGSRAAAAHWSYDGATGPEKWGISTPLPKSSMGSQQSSTPRHHAWAGARCAARLRLDVKIVGQNAQAVGWPGHSVSIARSDNKLNV